MPCVARPVWPCLAAHSPSQVSLLEFCWLVHEDGNDDELT